MNHSTQLMTLMGVVGEISNADLSFSLRCQSGDEFQAFVGPETFFSVLTNLDGLSNDTQAADGQLVPDSQQARVEHFLHSGRLITVQGVYLEDAGRRRFDARRIFLLASREGQYLFEQTHWWLTQIARLADQWLDMMFGSRRNYDLDDFVALYRTDLNILGLPTDDDIQECAVLSRLIYGFSAAYLLTGQERYRRAAEAGVGFQRDSFRSLSHDGCYCFWAYGRRKGKYGTEVLGPSQASDDAGSLPLYEQIYALAGLTLYYRLSLDPAVLEDIRRTINTFNDFFRDDVARPGDPAFQGYGGYFSHVDYATLRPNRNPLVQNDLKKNWNSTGDHIPAYLINLLLAIDPKPAAIRDDLAELLETCRDMLICCVRMIVEHFPDPNANVPYVNERFLADWTPDHGYSWQQNRAVIGHNFKIAWNLIRVEHYLRGLATRQINAPEKAETTALADKCSKLASTLAHRMTQVGIDQLRGGCFDTVEREPQNGMSTEFTWLNTKDFWQQEQAILAYLVLYGKTRDPFYLDMARRTEAFWNVFFLDRQNRGMYFRCTDDGFPVIDPTYAVRGGHSDASGYHCFELNFLAHIYNRCYVSPDTGTDQTFCLYFRPVATCGLESINVLPDFFPPQSLEITRITINGTPRPNFNPTCFQIGLSPAELGSEIVVEFRAIRGRA